jgi:hypothetical protein
MKKTLYVAPVTEIDDMKAEEQLLTISAVEGDTNIEIGQGDTPEEGDARNSFSIWDDED